MEEINNTVKVSIYGRQYSIAGEASRGDILLYAKYVDEKIESLMGGHQRTLNADLMVLIAMNIVEDLYKVKEERDEALQIIKEKNQEIEGQNRLWDETNSIIQEYEEAKEEIDRLERACDAVKKENAAIKEESRLVYKKAYDLREELDKLKKQNLQMQMFLPESVKSENLAGAFLADESSHDDFFEGRFFNKSCLEDTPSNEADFEEASEEAEEETKEKTEVKETEAK